MSVPVILVDKMGQVRYGSGKCLKVPSKTTKLILLDSLLQEVEATLPHLVLQKRIRK